jgi:hypothetical protein
VCDVINFGGYTVVGVDYFVGLTGFFSFDDSLCFVR